MQGVFRAGLVAAWIVFAALLSALLVPLVWEGLGGRDFRPAGVVLAVVLVTSAAVFRLRLGWSWGSLLGGLALIEVIALGLIAYFSGETGPDLLSEFNLLWLAYINIFIGLPWIFGAAVGSVGMRSKRQLARGRSAR